MESLQQQFGDILRRRREDAGFSQESLATKAKLHRTYISMLERGLRVPTLVVIKKLALALGTTMASLMEELEQVEALPTPPTPKTQQKRGAKAAG